MQSVSPLASPRSESNLEVENVLQSALTGLPIHSDRPAPPRRTQLDASWFRAWVAPLWVMLGTLVLSTGLWMACVPYGGSILAMLQAGPHDWLAGLPMPSWVAAQVIGGWIAFQLILLEFLPGKKFLGPITPAGLQPRYRQNGMAAWLVSHTAVFGGWWMGWLDVAGLYAHYGEILITLNLFAFAFCIFLYWKGRTFPTTLDAVTTGNPVFDFFQGIELHPRLLGVNLKQFINCRVSMMGWSTIFLAFAIAQYEKFGFVSNSMLVSTAVLMIYLFKFFWWESGYLHSIDIIHDRFGFYICWGVLVWVPAAYCLVALWLVEHPIELHPVAAGAMLFVGITAIWLNYDIDAQRQRVRSTKGETRVWGKAPRLIHARYTPADGIERTSLLLVSGWWGGARHFHYVPELVLAAAWTIPAGFDHFLPWFYWVFLFILLMDRARRDEKKCATKYGSDWNRYIEQVPWRVLPGLY